ncbi:MAG: hypothetical protein K2G80_07190, partial [Bacteroidales bacterium]|nr:hypothetical protein [Bacteroidales bacterium]
FQGIVGSYNVLIIVEKVSLEILEDMKNVRTFALQVIRVIQQPIRLDITPMMSFLFLKDLTEGWHTVTPREYPNNLFQIVLYAV